VSLGSCVFGDSFVTGDLSAWTGGSTFAPCTEEDVDGEGGDILCE
jgi:hypothetical protein